MSQAVNRKKRFNLSFKSSDYIVESSLVDFIATSTSLKVNTVLDYGCGNSPYEFFVNCDKYIKADIVQNEDVSVDILLNKDSFEPLSVNRLMGSVDMILCLDVLEHSGEIDKILNDFYRVLNYGGKVIISLPFLYREHEMPYDLYRYTSSAMEKLCREAGFKTVDIHKVGCYRYVLYSLWQESSVKYGEKIKQGLFGKIIKKLFNLALLPVFNKYVFKKYLPDEESVYHHLFIKATK